MKKLRFLKTLLDLFLFFSIIAIIGMIIFIGYVFLHNGVINIPVTVNGEKMPVADVTTKLILIFGVISYCVFVCGIYQLRKVLDLFSKSIIFEEDPILLLNLIGKNFLISALIMSVPLLMFRVFQQHDVAIEFGGGFSSFLFAASLGLFFMVLSEVFKIAKAMKDENDLMI